MQATVRDTQKHANTLARIAALAALALALAAACTLMSAPQAQAAVKASGTHGGCTWELTTGGTLTIAPADGTSGTLPSAGTNKASARPWYKYRTSIKKAVFEEGVVTGSSMAYFFYGCTKLTTIEGMGNVDASGLQRLGYTFYKCKKLTSIDFSSWSPSVVYLNWTFAYCTSLTTIDLSTWKTKKAERFDHTFYGCSKLEYADLSTWKTSTVIDFGGMFNGCKKLCYLDISGWNMKSATYVGRFVANCTGLRTFKVGKGYRNYTKNGGGYLYKPKSSKLGTGWWVNGSGKKFTDPMKIPAKKKATYTATFKGSKSINNAKVTLKKTSMTYTGSALQCGVKSVKVGGKTLKKGTDYKVYYSQNVNTGTAKVVIVGCGKYTGSVSKTFKIKK